MLVFCPVALGAGGAVSGHTSTYLEGAIASGLPVLAMISCFALISGAHFNPAVTIGLIAAKRFEPRSALPYLLAQFGGGIAAALIANAVFGNASGTHIPTDPSRHLLNIGTEGMLSAILMLTILRVESSKAATVIGLSVILLVLIGEPITGGSMNPARSLGPNIVAGGQAVSTLWIYFVGPILGMLAAAAINHFLEKPVLATPEAHRGS